MILGSGARDASARAEGAAPRAAAGASASAIPARPSASKIGQRLLTAAVGIPILYAVIKMGPVWLCFALVSVCAALAAREACILLETPERKPLRIPAMLGAILLGVPFLLPGGLLTHAAAMVLLLCLLFVAALTIRATLAQVVEAAMGSLFAACFVGLPLGYLTGLRSMDDAEMGRDLLVLLLVTIWVGDTAAMYVGSFLGRHRLAPRISPRKSVEGAVAGVLAGMGTGLLAHVWWFHRLPAGHAALVGGLLGLAGIGGDLAESIIKRAKGAKDSSSILPGHGGFLDRVDSLLLAGPALYYYYLAFLRHA